MPAHQLTFGPVGVVADGQDVHVLSNKSANVADLTCPECGYTLFVYYRHAALPEGTHERIAEADSDGRGAHDAQPQARQEQQEKGNKK